MIFPQRVASTVASPGSRPRFPASSHPIPFSIQRPRYTLPCRYIPPWSDPWLWHQGRRLSHLISLSSTNFSDFLPIMDLLEMPLGAIVFRTHSLPAAAAAAVSLWACLAVLAAALGLWRFRVVGSRSDSSLPPSPPPPKPEPAQAPAPVPVPAPKSLDPTALACHCPVEDACTPKPRFTAYFDPCDRFDAEDDGDDEAEVDNARKDDRVRDVRARSTAPVEGFGWEGLMIRRRGDLGWYRFQDLRALNGNVVRLWDGDGVSTSTAWRRLPMSL